MRSKKSYEMKANSKNIAHLHEKTLIIIMAYIFSAFNFLVSGLVFNDKDDIVMGVVMLFMIPIVILDKRKEMRGSLATALTCIMHFTFCLGISYLHSFWWMTAYLCEIIFCFIIVLISKRKADK